MPMRGGSQFETVAIPKRIQLVTQFNSRNAGTTIDGLLINCFAEQDPNDGEFWVNKRPGVAPAATLVTGPPSGLYVIKRTFGVADRVIYVVGNTLYSRVSGVPIVIGVLGAFGGTLRFTTMSYAFAGSSRVAVFAGTSGQGWITDGVAFNTIVDPDFPTVRVPGVVYLDNSVYVMTPEGDIRGSDLGDPLAWSALNSIAANDQADFGTGIARHLNYIVAFKQWSTQLFYNAGNPSGSPLRRVPGGRLSIGCLNGDTVQDIDDELFWIYSNQGVNIGAAKMSKGVMSKISNPAVERLLSTADDTGWISYKLKSAGHRFYVVSNSNANFTLVYDLDANLWYNWNAPDGNYWPYWHSTYTFDDLVFGTAPIYYVQASDGRIHSLAPDYENRSGITYTTDSGVVFPVEIYTQRQDFGTQRYKQLSAMYFKGDRVNGRLKLRWRDEDGEFNNFQEIDLSLERPQLADCGSFFLRQWHFKYSQATTFRMKTMDLQLDVGTL
jgi:hypothetical protein